MTFLGACEKKLTESLDIAVRSLRTVRLARYFDDWRVEGPNEEIDGEAVRILRNAALVRLSREAEYFPVKRLCESELEYLKKEMNNTALANVRIEFICSGSKGPIELNARAYENPLIWQWEVYVKVSFKYEPCREVWISAAITLDEQLSESRQGSNLRKSGDSVLGTGNLAPNAPSTWNKVKQNIEGWFR